MGIREMIEEKKRKFRDLQAANKQKVLIRETNKIREDNLRRSDVVARQNELNDARQVNQDLRAAQGPSRMQRFGKGLAAVMNKTQARSSVNTKTKKSKYRGGKLGQINQGSTGLSFGGNTTGSPFGGQRNIDFGGNSGGSPFNPRPASTIQPPRPKTKTIIRY